MEQKKISKAVLKRLPGYLAYLKNMPEGSSPNISATALANALDMGEVQVRKVYPEVRDGRFRIDFIFKGVRPGNIRTGQTYYVDLQLGQSKQAIIIPKGMFHHILYYYSEIYSISS